MRSKNPGASHATQRSLDVDRITQALAAPFDVAEVKFKPAVVSGNRALALAYVDARVIQDRLDDVLGVAGWQDSYRVLPDGSVMCRLRLRIGEQWISKTDVGGQSEQPDGGDRTKAAFSDALKRAAVKFGVGRYLYRLPAQWCDYDPHKRQFVRTPTLPAWARPTWNEAIVSAALPPAPVKRRPGAPIGADGARKLIALADRKGKAISAYLPHAIDAPGLLSPEQARRIWKQLEALPDAPSVATAAIA
jgi:hypothetical protein